MRTTVVVSVLVAAAFLFPIELVEAKGRGGGGGGGRGGGGASFSRGGGHYGGGGRSFAGGGRGYYRGGGVNGARMMAGGRGVPVGGAGMRRVGPGQMNFAQARQYYARTGNLNRSSRAGMQNARIHSEFSGVGRVRGAANNRRVANQSGGNAKVWRGGRVLDNDVATRTVRNGRGGMRGDGIKNGGNGIANRRAAWVARNQGDGATGADRSARQGGRNGVGKNGNRGNGNGEQVLQGGRNRDGKNGSFADAKRQHERIGKHFGKDKNGKCDHHDKNWWKKHCHTIVWVDYGYWGWYDGWWYPAWGYDPYYNAYAYDGPIYGYDGLPPDQVVASIQTVLQQMGYYPGEIDGVFGFNTQGALLRYQQDHGLPRTGAIDRETVRAMRLGG